MNNIEKSLEFVLFPARKENYIVANYNEPWILQNYTVKNEHFWGKWNERSNTTKKMYENLHFAQ